jgi:tetratricopeptide (TPR) repeat protein
MPCVSLCRPPPPLHHLSLSLQVTEQGLLQRRSVDANKSSESMLSARGLQHRSRSYFLKEVKASTAVIEQSHHGAPRKVFSPQIFNTYFQRALGFERLGKVDKALKDYSTCIGMDRRAAPAHFNRAGLYTFLGRLEEAIGDLNRAVQLDPGNITYRGNRALVQRRLGNFDGAIQDTITCRAIERDPSLAKDLANGEDLVFDSDSLCSGKASDDPIRICVRAPKGKRPHDENFEALVNFISSLKMFRGIAPDREGQEKIAQHVGMVQLESGTVIFDEGHVCDMFYMVFEGLISITKKFRGADRSKSNVLVNLASGQSFGDANLENGGSRTAGAVAAKKSSLLTLAAADYVAVMSGYRRALRNEVRQVLSTCPVFQTWDVSKLAETAARRSYNAGSSILGVGDPVRTLFMIIRGVVKLIKPIPRPRVNDIAVGEHYIPSSATGLGTEPPGLWVRELNWRERLDLDEKAMLDETSGLKKPSSEFTVGVVSGAADC